LPKPAFLSKQNLLLVLFMGYPAGIFVPSLLTLAKKPGWITLIFSQPAHPVQIPIIGLFIVHIILYIEAHNKKRQ
jgi:hypothetical protein